MDICLVCPDEVSSEQKQLRATRTGFYWYHFCSKECYRIYQYHEAIKSGKSREEFLQEELKTQLLMKQLEKEEMEEIHAEVIRIVKLFAEKHNLIVEIFFGKKGDENFTGENYNSRGFCKKRSRTENTFNIHILSDLPCGIMFAVLAHEFSHVLTQGFRHLTLLWKTLDEITFPFVKNNLSSEKDREELINFFQPSTNNDKLQGWVYLEPRKGRLYFLTDKENVDQVWEKIRCETLKSNLGVEAKTFRNKKNTVKYWVYVYTKNCQDKEDINRVKQKLFKLGFEAKEIII